jgi:hypothetical protein
MPGSPGVTAFFVFTATRGFPPSARRQAHADGAASLTLMALLHPAFLPPLVLRIKFRLGQKCSYHYPRRPSAVFIPRTVEEVDGGDFDIADRQVSVGYPRRKRLRRPNDNDHDSRNSLADWWAFI